MAISDIADDLSRGIESLTTGLSVALFEPVIRLGVTGLSRAGKTVFITSLVANLMDRGRMHGLQAEAERRIRSVFLQPQPDNTVPRFDYEAHLDALTGTDPHWPEGTKSVSELRLSFRVQPAGLFGGWRGPRTIHVDIVDYPGEWLLDLALLDQGYADWAAATLARMAKRDIGSAYLMKAEGCDAATALSEPAAKDMVAAFTGYLVAARKMGFSDCAPGRFLLPGELAGAPVLTFAPLRRPDQRARGSLWREMERRFEAYKREVVKPFFRDHFAKIDRQVVLIDVLGAIHAGPMAVEDMRQAMAAVLGVFRPGRNRWLSGILRGKRVTRILFAATKADHLHHTQHKRLTAITAALMRDARDRADFAGADTAAMSIASLRATVEETVAHDGVALDCVRGRLLHGGREAAFYPGELPETPARLLSQVREGAQRWLDADYEVMAFAPARLTLKPGDGPPHIRLDQVAEFLIGDAL